MGERRITEVKRRRHTLEQIVRKLREADRLLAGGIEVPEVAKALEVSEQTYHCWRTQFAPKFPLPAGARRQCQWAVACASPNGFEVCCLPSALLREGQDSGGVYGLGINSFGSRWYALRTIGVKFENYRANGSGCCL
jgi:Transposase